jgi:single-stranded-DNA-specific exonuclease
MKVIVTDHHLPGDSLPDADAIVNPAQPECEFPSKALAGVGVIFYVMSALRARLRESEWFSKQSIKEPNMADYLDLVALGTVADLVPLDFNNRILVEQGIRRMRAGRARPGISALFEVAGREIKNAVASDLGFAIGPRLNAAGRLDDMATGIECLRSRDLLDARQRAQSLNALNQERKHIEDEMRRDAEAALSEIEQSEEHSTSMSVVLYEPHWHQGVIGILASRIKERLNRPAIAFAPESDDPENIHILKGSARSISGLHMRDALDLVAKRHPKILKKFGGHAMAAGMSLERDMLDAFKAAFNQVVSELLKPEDLEAIAFSDGYLQSEELSLPMVELLERAGPWGQKFPEPRFDAEVRIVQSRVLKERHLKLVVEMPDKQLMDAIEFSSPHCGATLDKAKILFRPAINDYRGRRSVQLLVDQIEPL